MEGARDVRLRCAKSSGWLFAGILEFRGNSSAQQVTRTLFHMEGRRGRKERTRNPIDWELDWGTNLENVVMGWDRIILRELRMRICMRSFAQEPQPREYCECRFNLQSFRFILVAFL